MCDDGPCKDYAGKNEDVRATRTHTVSLTLLVQGEDSGKAIERVIAALGSGMHVERVSALPYEPEDDRW